MIYMMDEAKFMSDEDWKYLLERTRMKTTMTRRFYTGSKDMALTYLKNGEVPGNMMLLGEAIDKAKGMVENGDEIIFVVEVVKIVRRASQPVIVEDVR